MEDIDFMENPRNHTEDASDSTFLIVVIATENDNLLKFKVFTLRELYFIQINKLIHDFCFLVHHIFCALISCASSHQL